MSSQIATECKLNSNQPEEKKSCDERKRKRMDAEEDQEEGPSDEEDEIAIPLDLAATRETNCDRCLADKTSMVNSSKETFSRDERRRISNVGRCPLCFNIHDEKSQVRTAPASRILFQLNKDDLDDIVPDHLSKYLCKDCADRYPRFISEKGKDAKSPPKRKLDEDDEDENEQPTKKLKAEPPSSSSSSSSSSDRLTKDEIEQLWRIYGDRRPCDNCIMAGQRFTHQCPAKGCYALLCPDCPTCKNHSEAASSSSSSSSVASTSSKAAEPVSEQEEEEDDQCPACGEKTTSGDAEATIECDSCGKTFHEDCWTGEDDDVVCGDCLGKETEPAEPCGKCGKDTAPEDNCCLTTCRVCETVFHDECWTGREWPDRTCGDCLKKAKDDSVFGKCAKCDKDLDGNSYECEKCQKTFHPACWPGQLDGKVCAACANSKCGLCNKPAEVNELLYVPVNNAFACLNCRLENNHFREPSDGKEAEAPEVKSVTSSSSSSSSSNSVASSSSKEEAKVPIDTMFRIAEKVKELIGKRRQQLHGVEWLPTYVGEDECSRIDRIARADMHTYDRIWKQCWRMSGNSQRDILRAAVRAVDAKLLFVLCPA